MNIDLNSLFYYILPLYCSVFLLDLILPCPYCVPVVFMQCCAFVWYCLSSFSAVGLQCRWAYNETHSIRFYSILQKHISLVEAQLTATCCFLLHLVGLFRTASSSYFCNYREADRLWNRWQIRSDRKHFA